MNASGNRRGRSAANGFTMVELLVVVLIIGMISGVVAVSWQARLPRADLNATVHTLAATISGARSDAIARNGEFRLYYDLDANSYFVRSPYRIGGGLAQNDDQRLILRRTRLPESVNIARVTIDGVHYDEGTVYVSFDPQGSATGHTVKLLQASALTDPVTVEVLPLTGLVRFHYSDFERPPVSEDDFD